jgi:capsular exopolysaccharide synthesis family protein
VGALGVSTGSVLLRRALDGGLTTGQDAENTLGQPYLGTIADLASTVDKGAKGLTPIDYVKQKPLSVFAEGFRSVRAGLIYSRLGQDVKVIAITSSLPGEGKTTTSLCLSQTMAMSGQKVIVLDCDLRRRSFTDILKADADKGLLEVLAGTATLEEALLVDEKTGVHFLPLARSAYTPKDVFGSAVMDALLERLRASYDAVILDTAPVLPVVDTRILARKADAVAMLVRWRKTQRKAVQNSIALLEEAGANVAGVVLTQVNIKEQARYGYGDSGYYYKQYKKYYTE